jgi:hypothetical protein
VSLRIRHPALKAIEICDELDLVPHVKWSIGEQRKTPKGRKLKGIYDETYCTFKIEHEEDEFISTLLSRMNKTLKKKMPFLSNLISTGGSIEYFIGWYLDENAGDIFDSDLLKELSDLGISLSFDLYP